MMRGRRVQVVLVVALVAAAVVIVWIASSPADVVEPPLPSDLSQLAPELSTLIEYTRTEVQLDPEEDGPWGKLGMVYHANGMPALAGKCYDRATQLDEKQPRWWFFLALCSKEQGDLKTSQAALARTIKLDPSYAAAHWQQGLILLDLGRADDATESFRRAIELDGSDPAGYWGLARAETQRDKPEAAIKVLEGWLARNPQDAYGHGLLGQALLRAGQHERSRVHLHRSEGSEPMWVDSWSQDLMQYAKNTAVLESQGQHWMQMGNYPRAIDVYLTLQQKLPDDVFVLNKLGEAYTAAAAPDSALAVLEAARKLHPDHYRAYLNLATLHLRLDETGPALAFIEAALERNPSSAAAHQTHGDALLRLNRHEQALKAYRQAQQLDPRNPRFPQLIAGVHANRSDWQSVVAELAPVSDSHPTFVPGLVALTVAYIELGELDKADATLVSAEQFEPENPLVVSCRRQLSSRRKEGKQ